jgi:hypothetical protein
LDRLVEAQPNRLCANKEAAARSELAVIVSAARQPDAAEDPSAEKVGVVGTRNALRSDCGAMWGRGIGQREYRRLLLKEASQEPRMPAPPRPAQSLNPAWRSANALLRPPHLKFRE